MRNDTWPYAGIVLLTDVFHMQWSWKPCQALGGPVYTSGAVLRVARPIVIV